MRGLTCAALRRCRVTVAPRISGGAEVNCCAEGKLPHRRALSKLTMGKRRWSWLLSSAFAETKGSVLRLQHSAQPVWPY